LKCFFFFNSDKGAILLFQLEEELAASKN